MDWQTVYNTCDTPRRRDAAGHMIPSHSWGAADVDVSFVAADVAAYRLLIVETLDPVPAEGLDPAAAKAMQTTLTERQKLAPQPLVAKSARTTTTKTEA